MNLATLTAQASCAGVFQESLCAEWCRDPGRKPHLGRLDQMVKPTAMTRLIFKHAGAGLVPGELPKYLQAAKMAAETYGINMPRDPM